MMLASPAMLDNPDIIREAVDEAVYAEAWEREIAESPGLPDDVCNAACEEVDAALDRLRQLVLAMHGLIDAMPDSPISVIVAGRIVTVASDPNDPDRLPLMTITDESNVIRIA